MSNDTTLKNFDRDTELSDEYISNMIHNQMYHLCRRCGNKRGDHYYGGWCILSNGDIPSKSLASGKFTYQYRDHLDKKPFIESEKKSTATNIVAAINDYVCPTCKNDKCSKSERTCWKCGNKL